MLRRSALAWSPFSVARRARSRSLANLSSAFLLTNRGFATTGRASFRHASPVIRQLAEGNRRNPSKNGPFFLANLERRCGQMESDRNEAQDATGVAAAGCNPAATPGNP